MSVLNSKMSFIQVMKDIREYSVAKSVFHNDDERQNELQLYQNVFHPGDEGQTEAPSQANCPIEAVYWINQST
ncbi:hypothetical protein [Ureibacillus sp. GCM10028918]|uniref:hypothetical protein n=1 Tax=Ureibacillus sp. GCM10028918 TaxID=3273429 RepID=UPI0036130F18